MPITINGGFVLTGGMQMGNLAGLATGVGAWNFDGTNDLQILNPAPGNPTYTGNVTFEMWINPTGLSVSPVWWMPVDLTAPGVYNKLQWYLNGATLTAQNIAHANHADGASVFAPISTTLNLNAWNYVCFTVVNGVAILYVNGQLVGSSAASTYTYNLFGWYVGYDTSTNQYQTFNGQLTNIRMSKADVYGLAGLPATMTVPTSQLTVELSTMALYTMSDPNADITYETDSTGKVETNAGSPPTWVLSTPGPY